MEDMKRDLEENFKRGTFFNFDKMITPGIIKIIFIIGIALTTFLGLGMIIRGVGAYFGGGLLVFLGLLTLVLGPIVVRLYCELIVVIFKIHESLEDIRKK